MFSRFLELAITPAVRAAQEANGSREAYARVEGTPTAGHELSSREISFIAERDSFYMASVSETGWPYIQHRGGPRGFLRVLDPKAIAFADYRGNRQYLTVGNLANNDRVALILVDYPQRRRLKILGRASIRPLEDTDRAMLLNSREYQARIERTFLISIEGFDWNCQQHITPRFTAADIKPLSDRLDYLENENRRLREQLGDGRKQPSDSA